MTDTETTVPPTATATATEDAAVVDKQETSVPINAETELKEPERPAQRELSRPDNEKHQKEVEVINNEIKELRSKIDVITNKMKATQDPEKSEEVTNLKKEARKWKTESFRLDAEVKSLEGELRKHKDDIELYSRRKKAFTSEGNDAGAAEQDMLLGGAERAKKATAKRLETKKKDCEKAENALAQSKKDLAAFYEHLEVVKGKIVAMEKERDELRDEVNGKFKLIKEKKQKLDESFQEFFKNRDIWREYKKELHNHYQLKRKVEEAKWQAQKEAEEAAKIPYEDEMALCDFLVGFLEREFLGKTESKKAAAKEDDKFNKTLTTDDGKVLKAMNKKEEDFMVMGGGKKKKSKNRNKAEKLGHSVKIISDFSKLGLEPPSTRTAVAKSVEELKAKKQWYSEQPRPEKKKSKSKEERDESSTKDSKKKSGQYKSTSEDFPSLGGPKAPEASPEDATEGAAEDVGEGEGEGASTEEATVTEEDASPNTSTETKEDGEGEQQDDEGAPKEEADAADTTTTSEDPAPTASSEVAATKEAPPADKMTYSDDKALGEPMPDLSSLKWLQGEAPESGKPLVVLFWAKYAKGDYKHLPHFSHLADEATGAQFIGISCDAEEEDAAKLLTKFGKAMPEQNIPLFECKFPLAYDEGKVVGNAFKTLSALNTMSAGMAYIVDASGTIVWREGFTSSWFLEHGQFSEQLALLLDGKDLIDNGEAPKDDDEEVDEDANPTITTGPDPSEMFAETGDY